jgi:nitroreductase
MELISVIRGRRSVRDYMDVTVDRATVERLVDAAILAPSSTNRQPWAFAAILSRDRIDDLSTRAKNWLIPQLGNRSEEPSIRHMLEDPKYFLYCHAPALVLVMAACSEDHVTEDCCLAAENLMLAARNEGLGSCWVGLTRPWLNLPSIKAELKIPEHYQTVAPIILGHPRTWPEARERKPAEILWL